MLAAARFIGASQSDLTRRPEMNLKAMAVVAGAVVASTASGDAVQWRVQDGGNGHWYSLRPAACWGVAQSAAQAEGGYLATLTSAGERQFVGALVPSTDNTFTVIVGGSRVPSSSMYTGWTWVTGESFVYAAGEWMGGNPGCCAPNEYFLCVNRQGLLGDTAQCDTNRVVFEWSADCNNDGIVDYGQCRDGTLPDYNSNNVPDCCEHSVSCVPGRYPIEWPIEVGGNGHWYHLSEQTFLTQPEAVSFAASMGASLATVTTSSEYQRLLAAGFDGCWLGGRRSAANPTAWEWLSGEPWSYSPWANDPRSTSEPWLILISSGPWCCGFGDSGPWLFRAAMEWSSDCNNDGIVDYGQILRGELADTNANGVPDICDPCIGDIVQDGLVNGIDLAAVLNNWGTKGGVIDADVNNDGIVDGSDLSIVLNGWGACP